MPTGVCQTCGTTVRFEGSAGLCPNCGTVMRAGQRAAKSPPGDAAKKSSSSQPPKKPGRSKGPVDLESLNLESDEQFAPPESSSPVGNGTDPVILYLSIGAGAVILVFGLFVILRGLLSKPDTIAPPPPAPLVTNIAPPAPIIETPPIDISPVVKPNTVATATTTAATRPAWMSFKPSVPTLPTPAITDKLVGDSITKAVAYLKTQFVNDEMVYPSRTDNMYEGIDALAVNAFIHAGEAIKDPDLLVSSPFMQQLINRMKQYQVESGLSIYFRALRASALAIFNREVDRDQLTKDRDFLLKAPANGAFDYNPLPPKTPADSLQWDNSNSQYGVLGTWAASSAGLPIPDKFWLDVEQHWLNCQNTDGGWPYNGGQKQSLTSMTAAGVTTLCVIAEQLELISSKGKHDAHPKLQQAVDRGVNWLGTGNNLDDEGINSGYNLYGIERAALTTGYRFFGDHDWYRELGAREIKDQKEEGQWSQGPGGVGSIVETSFRILFLSRGRQPLMMNKLRFDGDWNDRPRDVAKLAEFTSLQLERPFAWGVVDLKRKWEDWMECPVLFISTDAAPNFSDDDCKKLRAYTDAGGLIFIHNEYGSSEVDSFVAQLVKRAYPEYPMTKVLPNSLDYSVVYPIKKQPVLGQVGNGIRTFLVYSPKDITQDWVRFRAKDSARDNANLQIGLNLFVTAAGKSEYRNRLDSPFEEVPDFAPIGTLPVFQLTYPGNWNPEPKAYERFSRWFQKQTSLKLAVQPTSIPELDSQKGPIAVLTGTAPIESGKMDLRGLRDFVSSGGVLFIDAAGGSTAFTESVESDFLPAAFPGVTLSALPPNHPIFSAGHPCMDALPRPRLRSYATFLLAGNSIPDMQYANVGKGTIIFAPLDVTDGLLDAGTFAINGYTPTYCQSLVKNVILWALSRYSH